MESLLAREALRSFEPDLEPDEVRHRRILCHPEVYEWLHPPASDKPNKQPPRRFRRHRADARALLKQFVVGKDFDDDAYFKRLDPPPEDIYEFRLTFNPQARIFGAFTRPGEFVATFVRDREKLDFDKWMQRSDERLRGLVRGHAIPKGVARGLLLQRFNANA